MKKLSEVSKKTWALSGLLTLLSIVFILYGVFEGKFEWIWIILCFAAAVVNIFGELRLAPTTKAEEEQWRQQMQNVPEPAQPAETVDVEEWEEVGEEDGEEEGKQPRE